MAELTRFDSGLIAGATEPRVRFPPMEQRDDGGEMLTDEERHQRLRHAQRMRDEAPTDEERRQWSDCVEGWNECIELRQSQLNALERVVVDLQEWKLRTPLRHSIT